MPLLTRKEVDLLKSLAKNEFLKIPHQGVLNGKELTHGDRLAISYYEASLRLLAKKCGGTTINLLDEGVNVEVPDSDPETEYADWPEIESPAD